MNLSFEEKMKHLEELVRKLEQENLSLDESVKIFQEAKDLSLELEKDLKESMEKLSYIVQDGQISKFDLNKNDNVDI